MAWSLQGERETFGVALERENGVRATKLGEGGERSPLPLPVVLLLGKYLSGAKVSLVDDKNQ